MRQFPIHALGGIKSSSADLVKIHNATTLIGSCSFIPNILLNFPTNLLNTQRRIKFSDDLCQALKCQKWRRFAPLLILTLKFLSSFKVHRNTVASVIDFSYSEAKSILANSIARQNTIFPYIICWQYEMKPLFDSYQRSIPWASMLTLTMDQENLISATFQPLIFDMSLLNTSITSNIY